MQRRMFREHKKENRKLPDVSKSKMSFKRRKLMIDDQPYVQYAPPTTEDIANLTEMDQIMIDNLTVYESATQIEGFSRFIGYTTTAITMDDVKRAYIKIRGIHETATYVACACYLDVLDRNYKMVQKMERLEQPLPF